MSATPTRRNSEAPVRSDPITFEVAKNALAALADEMAITMVRTAHSQLVRDVMDFSTAICDANGRVIAQGCGIPMHLGAMPDAMDGILTKYRGGIHEGDVFVLNDPDAGGMHLPDVFVIKPVFGGTQPLGYAACVAHHQDIGGRMPGGNAVDSTEIFQEGLQIPPLKLYERGRANETLLALWLRNVRIPDVVYGDIQAQLSACHVGEAGLKQLADKYTADGLQLLMDEILDYTEARVRAELNSFPEGEYSFEDHIDDDGMGSGPIAIRVKIAVVDSKMIVDFDGTSPQVRSALNGTMSYAKSAVYTALMCVLGSDIPTNDGYYRPITVKVPVGTILNPVRPAPRAARGLTGFRTVDAILGALGQALPGRVPAAGEGGASMIAMGGTHKDGRAFIFVDFIAGGWGARADRDGVDAVSPIAANMSNVPIEVIELHQPVRIERYGFVPDTGGPGKWRGCLSIAREWRLMAEEGILQIRSDRRLFPPYGLAGGGPGSPSTNILNPGAAGRGLPSKVTLAIKGGDVVRHVMAGGGGYGDPWQRDPALILADVLDEKMSVDHAQEHYGVVIDRRRNCVDVSQTDVLRSRRSHLDDRA